MCGGSGGFGGEYAIDCPPLLEAQTVERTPLLPLHPFRESPDDPRLLPCEVPYSRHNLHQQIRNFFRVSFVLLLLLLFVVGGIVWLVGVVGVVWL